MADTFRCRLKPVGNVRWWCMLEDFELALHGEQRCSPPAPKLVDGRQETRIVALSLSTLPEGYSS